jgi:hypothetical protein
MNENIKNYCCVMSSSAIRESAGYGEISIKFANFVGENVWYIEVPEKTVGGNNLISFCPWCGSKLPAKPIE